MKATRTRRPLADRLFAKLQPMPNGCIEFTGKRLLNNGGKFPYGIIHLGGKGNVKYLRTHRVVWEMTHGPIPDGYEVCHSCDNPPCCNPDHLFLGTKDDNMRDMGDKLRSRCSKQTHCVNGHEFTPENTLPRPARKGRMGRRCKTCRDNSNRKKSAA